MLRWSELRAVELVADEVAAYFDDEDPLRWAVRERLDETKAQPQGLVLTIDRHRQPVELTEPTQEQLADIRALVDRGSGLLPDRTR